MSKKTMTELDYQKIHTKIKRAQVLMSRAESREIKQIEKKYEILRNALWDIDDKVSDLNRD